MSWSLACQDLDDATAMALLARPPVVPQHGPRRQLSGNRANDTNNSNASPTPTHPPSPHVPPAPPPGYYAQGGANYEAAVAPTLTANFTHCSLEMRSAQGDGWNGAHWSGLGKCL